MDDNFDMGSLPTLENLDGSTEEPIATHSSNYSSAQNNQNTIPQNAYRQNNYSPVNQNNQYQQNNFNPVNQNNRYQQNNFDPVNQNNVFQQNSFNPVNQNNAFQQNSFNPVNQNLQRQNYQQYNNMPNNSFPQRSANTLDSFWSDHEEKCRRGEKITKVIGIIVIILSILDLISAVLSFRILQAILIGVRIYFSKKFIDGKDSARIYMIVIMFLSAGANLILAVIADTLYSNASYSVQFSAIGVVQGIFVIATLLYGGVGVFLIVSKSIEAYFSR